MREMTMNTAAASHLVRISPSGTKVRTIPATVQRFAPSAPLRARLRVAAYARVSTDEEEQLSSYEAQVDYYTRYIQSNPECERLQEEQDAVSQQMNRMIRENAEVAQNQAEYNARLQPLEERYEALKNAMLRTKEAISEQTGRRRRLEAFMRELRESSLLTAFDEHVFLGTVERITVFKGSNKGEKRLVFRFKDGRDVAVSL